MTQRPLQQRLQRWRKRLWTLIRLLLFSLLIALVFDRDVESSSGFQQRIFALTRDQSFDYITWEVEALWSKSRQELVGFQAYIPEAQRKTLLLEYFELQRSLWTQEGQLATLPLDDPNVPLLTADISTQRETLREQQSLVEHLIEGQVSRILQREGLAVLGQIVPPVTMRFLHIPDMLIVSPRHEIRQVMTVTLQPQELNERVALETAIAAAVPEMSVWVTPVGGVGLYPAMITETDRAVVAFEITAHEWVHHYLLFFPLGLEYFSHPDTRIINETTATLVGDEIGNRVIEHFYAEELAAGRVYLQQVPDYRQLLAAVNGLQVPAPPNGEWGSTPSLDRLPQPRRDSARLLADYLLLADAPQAAQAVLNHQNRIGGALGQFPATDPTLPRADADRGGWIHHTRVSVDYLLGLGNVMAAEHVMNQGERHTGLRVLNQAWFAFNAGYQSNPVIEQSADGTLQITTSGGGGDPIGAAIYEIRARSDSLKHFLMVMRGITTREGLLQALEQMRAAVP